MSKVDDILEKHLSLMVGRAEQSYVSVDEMKKQPEYQATKDAMLEFAKHILEEAYENAKVDELGRVSNYSITNTLNKYL